MTTGLRVCLLGGFECRASEEALSFPTRKVRALLAYLAAHVGEAQRRDKLAALLFEDKAEDEARVSLRKTLSRLRESLPEEARDALVADAGHLALRPDAVTIDLALLERDAALGTPDSLERAAGLYRGPFLEGFPAISEGFDAWVTIERQRVEEVWCAALRRLLELQVVTGAVSRAIQTALRLLAVDPLQESVHRTLIRLYMYQDRLGTALAQYERCRRLLADELGVSPSPETLRLEAEIRRLAPGATATPDGDALPERVLSGEESAARTRPPAPLSRPSVVVLPFATGDVDRHLGDGLAEAIATELGRFRELTVVAPTSALAYSNVPAPPELIGRELGTTHVALGRLRHRAGGLAVSVRLIESETGRQLWAERYDGADPQALEDRIARHVVGEIAGRIEDDRLEVARRRPPRDQDAYELCLRGWSALRRPDLGAVQEARRLFAEAVARDPHFARAYVGLAMTHLSEWACFTWNHWVFPAEEVLELAKRAVELDARDHRAHCILGMAQLYAGEDDAARRRLIRALELNPNDGDVLAHVAVGMALLGEHRDAVACARSALRLAPHHPEWYAAFAGEALFAARLHEEVVSTLTPAPEALCNTPAILAAAWAHLGRPERAAAYRDTVQRHHRQQLARGLFPDGMDCIDWLLAITPFRLPADAEHYVEGLRKAGFG